MVDHILWALWFFAPAGAGNVAPLVAAHIPFIKRYTAPIDFGKTYRGKPVFGSNKTWRGLASGTLFGLLAGSIQVLLVKQFHLAFIPAAIEHMYISGLAVVLGAVLGISALLGDAIESFFKRQIGVPPGKHWFPFDQLDYIIGGCLASLLVVRLAALDYLTIIIVWFGIHLLSSYIGYLIRWKQEPF